MITEFPLLVFTVLTSIAAGSYVAAAAFPPKEQPKNPWLLPLVCLVLAAVGSLASIAHVGRPSLVLGVLANPTSALTLEGIFAGVFCLGIAISLVLAFTKKANRVVDAIVAVLGVVLLLMQAHAYATSYGVAAWCSAAVWPFVVVTGIAGGFPLAQALGAAEGGKTPGIAACVVLVLGALCGAAECVVFNGAGADGVAVIACGAVVMLAGAVVAYLGKDGKKTMVLAAAILAIAGLAIMRYGFYMASIL